MNCTRYRQLISRYVDDEVTPRQRRELLAHVEVCRDCASWLARARQTDVLLKPLGDTHPSESVRNAIFTQLRNSPQPDSIPPAATPKSAIRNTKSKTQNPLGAFLSSILLRFDPSPGRIAFGTFVAICASLGLLFWLNILPQFWSNKLGFEVQPDTASVGSTPITAQAISSNQNGSDASNAPTLVLAQPGDGSQVSILDSPVVMRFDMPMDRGSVEDALLITPPAAGTLLWEADNQLRWTPSEPGLLRGITYTVTLSGTPLSLAGTPLQGVMSWSFRTSEPHAVVPSPTDGSTIAPADPLSLAFDVPMQVDTAQSAVSLRAADTSEAIPASFTWNAEGTQLTINPLMPLPQGNIFLRVDATSPTRSGETLGRAYEYTYRSEVPTPRVRLLDGRVLLSSANQLARTGYEAVSGKAAGSQLEAVSFEVYSFPAEMLSSLGAQSSAWPQTLPAGFPAGLALATTSQATVVGPSTSGDAFLPSLPAGIYLVIARGLLRSEAASPTPDISDWQLLIVGDYRLHLIGPDMPFWAVTEAGHSWAYAEVSLYSASGELLDKGITDENGLFIPAIAAKGATLAIARDPSGHTAPLVLGDDFSPQADIVATLPASLITDREAYRPGDVVNFRASMKAAIESAGEPARIAEPSVDSVTAELLTPQGYLVSSLSLKTDAVGGASGLFPLASGVVPGTWAIRIRWGDAEHSFPLTIVASQTDILSLAILPTAEDTDSAVITRTVSVLGPNGRPLAGVGIIGRLGIMGDPWVSNPIVEVTDNSGLATFVMPLPSWLDRFNDPGLLFRAETTAGRQRGSATAFLDLTSQRSAASGLTQVVSPLQNVAVVARIVSDPTIDSDPYFKIRAVLLDPALSSGDIVLIATSPTGVRRPHSLNLASLPGGDATIDLPLNYAGGTISILSSNSNTPRLLSLIPASAGAADLHILAPVSAGASVDIPVRLTLGTNDGLSLSGDASLVWRRAGGTTYDLPTAWEPAVSITSSGVLTLTLQAPTTPGLWYLFSEATTTAGPARSSTAVRVLPAPWVQLPTTISAEADTQSTFGVRIFNPGPAQLNTNLQVRDTATSKFVAAPAYGWSDQTWTLSPTSPGQTVLLFSLFSQDGGTSRPAGWPLPATYTPHLNTNVTYTSGTLTGERSVGVAVPWDISGSNVGLEIRASTSLLSTLGGIARDLYAAWTPASSGVASAATRLSAGAPVASSYVRVDAPLPDGVLLSGVERSSLLQQIYSAQQANGSWSDNLSGEGTGSIEQTAAVLIAFYRASYYPYGDGHLQPDSQVIEAALNYLADELSRPLSSNAAQTELDSRAYGLYAYSLYRQVPADWSRPMLASSVSIAGASAKLPSLSLDGAAYLALSLMQSGRTEDALALLDTILRVQPSGSTPASAPMLIAMLQVEAEPNSGQPFNATYTAIRNPQTALRNSRYVQSLMGAREGAGWHTSRITADAIWALSLYAAMEQESVLSTSPLVFLSDHPIQSNASNGIPGELSVLLSGDALKAGTNWLKLRSPSSGEPLYYSLTLIAKR